MGSAGMGVCMQTTARNLGSDLGGASPLLKDVETGLFGEGDGEVLLFGLECWCNEKLGMRRSGI